MLELLNISKRFGSQTALENLSLSIGEGEFFSLLGPSGCGKSTLLRILAGLEEASSGQILLNGQRVDNIPAQKRPFNMVFQRYALFPHMSVGQNIAYGLKLKNRPAKEIEGRVAEALALVGLSDFALRRPETLSGGQQQRVAVARALVNEPKVLLLDEPLSALDQKMREHMQRELRALQQRLGITFIYVTHDQEEAMVLSDRIGIMNGGILEQVSTPREIYEKPQTSFAARFIGQMSVIEGELVESDHDTVLLKIAENTVIRGKHQLPKEVLRVGMQMSAYVRPEKIKLLSAQSDIAGVNTLSGRLGGKIFKGHQTEAHVDILKGGFFKVLLQQDPESLQFDHGTLVSLCFSPEDTHVFQGDSQ